GGENGAWRLAARAGAAAAMARAAPAARHARNLGMAILLGPDFADPCQISTPFYNTRGTGVSRSRPGRMTRGEGRPAEARYWTTRSTENSKARMRSGRLRASSATGSSP